MKKQSRLIAIFSELKDHRVNRTRIHSLENIVFISIAAVICGAETWNEIEEFGYDKREWLDKFLDLENGIPSHDTFNRFFSNLDPEKFEECFRRWVSEIVGDLNDEVIAIDGKSIRNSRTSGDRLLHVVSAWSTKYGVSLGQINTSEKSNEITAIPELLDALIVKGGIVTIDAIGCYVDIAEKIIDRKANYVLALKDNQKHLHNQVISSFVRFKPHSISTTEDFGHGRIETRTCYVLQNLSLIKKVDEWKNLKSIICIEKECINKVTGEVDKSVRHYISSLDVSADKIAAAVRSHWGIENNLHWMLDIAFGEDFSLRQNKNAQMNFSALNKMALIMLTKDDSKKIGIKSKRKKAGWSNEYLEKILGI